MTNARLPSKRVAVKPVPPAKPKVKPPRSKSMLGLPSGTRAQLAILVTEPEPVPYEPPIDVPHSKSAQGLPSGTKARKPDPEVIILREQAAGAMSQGADPGEVAALFLELAGEPLNAESI